VLQIIGTLGCTQTRKAVRFCQERSVAFQFVDLKARSLSEGEWKKIFAALDADSLIDTSSTYYKKNGYQWREFDPIEELKEHPQLLKTPLLKRGHRVLAHFDEAFILAKDSLA